MLPGEFIEPSLLSNIVSDIAVLSSLGLKIVVVHGARKQIEEGLQTQSYTSEIHKGVRITPQTHLDEILKAVGTTRSLIELSLIHI